MKTIKKENVNIALLYILPLIGLLMIGFYSHPIISRAALLMESAILACLLFVNIEAISTPLRLAVFSINILSMVFTLAYHSGLGCMLAFFNLIVAFLVFNHMVLPVKHIRQIRLVAFVALMLYFLMAKFKSAYGAISFLDFTGNLINPNMIGLLIMTAVFFAINYASLMELKDKTKLLTCIIIECIGLVLVWLTDCRSALVALFLFGLAVIFIRKPLCYKWYKAATVTILLGSLLFTVVYLVLFRYVPNFTILNKSLFTGRQIVWSSAFEKILQSPIIGNGTDVKLDAVGGHLTTSAHHMLLSLWYTLGVIPVATTTMFFINRSKNSETAAIDRVSQLAIICSLLVGFFESFYTEPVFQVFFILFLLSNITPQEEREIK